jgi:hypothetical protein
MPAEVVATVGTSDGRPLHVVRQPFAVTITDHPDPAVHSGWTMRCDEARVLGEALLKAQTLTHNRRPRFPKLRDEWHRAAGRVRAR